MSQSKPKLQLDSKSKGKPKEHSNAFTIVPCPAKCGPYEERAKSEALNVFQYYCPKYLKIKLIYDHRSTTDDRYGKCCWFVIYKQVKRVPDCNSDIKILLNASKPPTVTIAFTDSHRCKREWTAIYLTHCVLHDISKNIPPLDQAVPSNARSSTNDSSSSSSSSSPSSSPGRTSPSLTTSASDTKALSESDSSSPKDEEPAAKKRRDSE